MKNIIPIIALILIITSCAHDKKQATVRDVAISLIEKGYQVNGRRIEYSQIDSTDADLKGYFIGRIYIDNNDSIRVEKFHVNYIKTNVDIFDSFTISSDEYKVLLKDNKIFTTDMDYDFKRIYGRLCGVDIEQYYDED